MFRKARRPDESRRGGERKEPKSSLKGNNLLGRLSGDACRRDDGLKTTAGGAVSFAPPHTPPPYLYGWWYLAWVWVCVEGRKETAPCDVLSTSSCRQASPY